MEWQLVRVGAQLGCELRWQRICWSSTSGSHRVKGQQPFRPRRILVAWSLRAPSRGVDCYLLPVVSPRRATATAPAIVNGARLGRTGSSLHLQLRHFQLMIRDLRNWPMSPRSPDEAPCNTHDTNGTTALIPSLLRLISLWLHFDAEAKGMLATWARSWEVLRHLICERRWQIGAWMRCALCIWMLAGVGCCCHCASCRCQRLAFGCLWVRGTREKGDGVAKLELRRSYTSARVVELDRDILQSSSSAVSSTCWQTLPTMRSRYVDHLASTSLKVGSHRFKTVGPSGENSIVKRRSFSIDGPAITIGRDPRA